MESDAPCRRKVATVYTLRLPTEEVKLKVKAATCYFFSSLLFVVCLCEHNTGKMSALLFASLTVQTDSADTGETWRVYILTVIHVSKHSAIEYGCSTIYDRIKLNQGRM